MPIPFHLLQATSVLNLKFAAYVFAKSEAFGTVSGDYLFAELQTQDTRASRIIQTDRTVYEDHCPVRDSENRGEGASARPSPLTPTAIAHPD
jgi:hypothetical protein